MNSEQIDLYAKIQAFLIDQPDVEFPFSQRLARDNSWSLEYTERVIEEYKKFIFLAVAAGHPVTPSDQVDQVWHLHLSYTRSYWEDLCQNVLPAPLHHDPTLGGYVEDEKFYDWYAKTLESYQQFFGQTPPVEIWPAPENRFGQDTAFVRVNTHQNWVLPRVEVRKILTVGIFMVLALVSGGCYVGFSETPINSITGILFITFCLAAAFGFIRVAAGIIDFIKDPSRPRIGGCSGGVSYGCGGGYSGCGSGCGGGGGCGGG